ncbi:MAG: hypothetical protein ABIF77_04135 [bacterium]
MKRGGDSLAILTGMEALTSSQVSELAATMASLDKLFNIVPYYPAKHARCVEVARAFKDTTRHLLRGKPTLCIEGCQDGLLVHGRLLDSEQQGVKRTHDILETLGIIRLEIDILADTEDLHQFTSVLLQARHKAKVSHGFEMFDFSRLPVSTRAVLREFGQRTPDRLGPATNHEQIRAAVESALNGLENLDLDPTTRASCKELVEKVFARVADQLDRHQPATKTVPGKFTRSLKEVLDLGVHAIQHALRQASSRGQLGEGLNDLFGMAEKALALSENEQSVELMLSVLRQARQESPSADSLLCAEEDVSSEGDHELPLSELRSLLGIRCADVDPLETLVPPDNGEWLGVLLESVNNDPSPAVQQRIARELRSCLEGVITVREQSVLSNGVATMCQRVAPNVVDVILPAVLQYCRRTESESPARFLVGCAPPGTTSGHEAVWPHAVNEILLGLLEIDELTVDALHRLVSTVPATVLATGVERLENLEALRDCRLAKRLLHRPPAQLNPVFASLLSSSRADVIGAMLWKGLQRTPPSWPGAAIIRYLPAYKSSWHQILADYLKVEAGSDEIPALLDRISQILVEQLTALPATQRNEEWVPLAITVLGERGHPTIGPFLEDVLGNRKFGLFHQWPAVCRTVAERALKQWRINRRKPHASDGEHG